MTITIVIAMLSAIVVAGVGGALTTIDPWYRALQKPRWQPPDWAFGPAWGLILGMAGWAGALAWDAAPDEATRIRVLVLFGFNASCHILWSPLFFRWRRPDWALIECGFLWASVLALVIGLAPFAPAAAGFVAPYLVWVTFAAALNWAVVRLNPPFGPQAEQV